MLIFFLIFTKFLTAPSVECLLSLATFQHSGLISVVCQIQSCCHESCAKSNSYQNIIQYSTFSLVLNICLVTALRFDLESILWKLVDRFHYLKSCQFYFGTTSCSVEYQQIEFVKKDTFLFFVNINRITVTNLISIINKVINLENLMRY